MFKRRVGVSSSHCSYCCCGLRCSVVVVANLAPPSPALVVNMFPHFSYMGNGLVYRNAMTLACRHLISPHNVFCVVFVMEIMRFGHECQRRQPESCYCTLLYTTYTKHYR